MKAEFLLEPSKVLFGRLFDVHPPHVLALLDVHGIILPHFLFGEDVVW
jgi:hypothetical protein